MQTDSMSNQSSAKSGNAKKQTRQRPLPPNVTARNLAIEIQRREALNEDFLVGFWTPHLVRHPHRRGAKRLASRT